MKKLLILDSNSILNRAFYGVRYLSAKDGTPTNAIYGFLNILLKLIKEQEPDYICAAFDVKAPTFRHKQYEGYKAQRKPMPEGLAAQMPLAKDVLRAMGVTILEKEGYEADDIIGTVARLCEESEISCFIATGDKDDLQLASDKTKVILTVTKSGYNETIIYDDKAVKEKYHVTPTEFIDVKALMGDPSDNIPGVKGVGEKTAMSLIEKHHSIEYIYENIDDIGLKGAMLQKMKDGREMAFMSKELATINRNTPIEFNAEKCVFDGFENNGELYEILKRLELNSIIKKLDLSGVDNVKENEDIFKDFSYQVGDKNMISGDKVTVVLDFDGDNISSAAVGAGNNAVVLNEQDDIKELLEDDSIAKVMFDVKEAIVKLNCRIDIKNIADDTAIAAYLVDPAKNEYTIEKLASEYFGTVIEKPEVKQLSLLDDVETDRSEYLAKCAVALGVLNERIGDKIKENGQEKLYQEVELPLVTVLAHLEINGFLVDDHQLKEFADKLGEKIDALTNEIYMLAGEEFNINSPKQLGVILFEKLGMPNGKKTKSGYSTAASVLEKLAPDYPFVEKILEYRQLAKLKSTYADGLAVYIKDDGRIYGKFNQTITATGRISSTEPNLQNIPIRMQMGRAIRKVFVPKEGCVYIDADYSQIELRIMAHMSGDAKLIEAYKSAQDIHRVTASQVFKVPFDEVTDEQRRNAKAVNFGIIYGISSFGLSQDLSITRKEAAGYIEKYFETYPDVKKYIDSLVEEAKGKGYSVTMYNRRRQIPELKSANFMQRQFGERVAMNAPIQGTAADIIKLAMIRVYNELKNRHLKSKLILQVHDELLIETYKDELDEVKAIVEDGMKHAATLSVPLEIDMKQGNNWLEAH